MPLTKNVRSCIHLSYATPIQIKNTSLPYSAKSKNKNKTRRPRSPPTLLNPSDNLSFHFSKVPRLKPRPALPFLIGTAIRYNNSCGIIQAPFLKTAVKVSVFSGRYGLRIGHSTSLRVILDLFLRGTYLPTTSSALHGEPL